LRISAASAGNDHRLGANEAPPAIVSIFIGDELQEVLDAIENGTKVKSKNVEFVIDVDALPNFKKDTTDRNRTSPFAFTGNKFEFRMLGSADSISCTNVMLNTIVAEELSQFADILEPAKENGTFDTALNELLVKTIKEHKRIIFNGNGYSDEWIEEAVNVRKLPNYVSTVDCLPHYTDEKNVKMFEKFKVYTAKELEARTEILLENYSKVINIEALTMVDMANKQILPSCMKYNKEICDMVISKKQIGLEGGVEEDLAKKLSCLISSLDTQVKELEGKLCEVSNHEESVFTLSRYYRDEVFASMQSLRAVADELEVIVSEEVWPFPTYSKLLFNI
jgi:glutamine synthetase